MPAIFSTSYRDELRRRMMDAGWGCLLERGYRGTRIEGVAARARGLSAVFHLLAGLVPAGLALSLVCTLAIDRRGGRADG